MNTVELYKELSNRDKVAKLTSNIRTQILDGELNPLEAAIILKGMEDMVSTLRKDILIQDATLQELEKYGAKNVSFGGAKFQIKEVGTTYDFSQCGDPVYCQIKHDADVWAEKVKAREAFLKSVPVGGVTAIDETTGEFLFINPPAKRSRTGYAVTL
jgi:hypothetical protein